VLLEKAAEIIPTEPEQVMLLREMVADLSIIDVLYISRCLGRLEILFQSATIAP
jgi:hypothetical protein